MPTKPKANRSTPGGAAPAAQEPLTAPHRMALYLCLGSLGSDYAAALAERHPEAKGRLLAIDTARPMVNGRGPADPPEWQVHLPNADVKTLARSRRLALLDDGLIPRLEYPDAVHNGALQVRLFSTIKFAEAIPVVRVRLRHLIGEALDGADGRPLQVVIVSSVAGGTGSALILPVALLVRDEVRRVSPGAAVDVTVLGVLPSFFLASGDVQQTDRERLRLEANAAMTLREIKYLQSAAHAQPLRKALGANGKHRAEAAPITALYLYGSEATGGTLTQAKLTDRLVAAALTQTHPGVAEIDRNQGNAAAQYWGAYGSPEHAIVGADAVRSAWLPPAIRDLYVQTLLTEALAAAVRKAEAEQTDGLAANFKARLGLESIEAGIQQTIDELAPSEKVTVDPQIARLSSSKATDHLNAIHRYFKAEVMPQILAAGRSKAREVELVLVPEATRRVYDAILAEASGLDQAREVCEALVRTLTEDANSHAAERGEMKEEDYAGGFQIAVERLKKGGLIRARSHRINAAKACDDWKWAKKQDVVLQLKERAYRLAARQFQTFAAEAAAREARLRERLAEASAAKEEAQRASSAATDALRSVVRPDELAPFLQRVGQGIEVALGETPALLTPSRLMQPGLDELLAEHAAECGRRFDTFLRHHLKSLSGVAAFGRLRFVLADWAAESVGKLAVAVPLDLLPVGGAGNAASHQYLAAGGEEYRRLREMKAADPKFRAFNVVDTGDPFFVAARFRYAGLPFSVVPAADYEAAAAQYDEMDQTKAVNVLVSGGWVAGARNETLSDEEPVGFDEPAYPAARRSDHASNGEPAAGQHASGS